MEAQLKIILETITEINGKTFMMNAPEATSSPYCVYTRNREEPTYILTGVDDTEYQLYDINIYSSDTVELKTISKKVKDKLHSLLGITQGAFLIQSVKIHIADFYDSTVNMFRTVIELEIKFKEA